MPMKSRRDDRTPKIGVALSGGGVRGFAHLGVLQVLEEADIPVQAIAGTSMGGLVAGLYAAGVPLQALIDFANKVGIMDLASPDERWRGLFDHDKMAPMLANLLGDPEITFEDLDIPAAVVAADVERRELVLLREGPLLPALLATAAFPLVFTPVYHQGRWLVDGGVANNFPVDVVRHMGADRVLGVNVPPSVRLGLDRETHNTVLSVRALSLLTHRTREWQLPFLIADACVGISIDAINRTRLALCPPDLLLEVHLPNVGIFSTNKNGEAIAAGYRLAREHWADLVALRSRPLPPRWQRRLASIWRRARLAWAVFREPDQLLCGG
jgi:NTE family protein